MRICFLFWDDRDMLALGLMMLFDLSTNKDVENKFSEVCSLKTDDESSMISELCDLVSIV